jgi:hypothetical protein
VLTNFTGTPATMWDGDAVYIPRWLVIEMIGFMVQE